MEGGGRLPAPCSVFASGRGVRSMDSLHPVATFPMGEVAAVFCPAQGAHSRMPLGLPDCQRGRKRRGVRHCRIPLRNDSSRYCETPNRRRRQWPAWLGAAGHAAPLPAPLEGPAFERKAVPFLPEVLALAEQHGQPGLRRRRLAMLFRFFSRRCLTASQYFSGLEQPVFLQAADHLQSALPAPAAHGTPAPDVQPDARRRRGVPQKALPGTWQSKPFRQAWQCAQ